MSGIDHFLRYLLIILNCNMKGLSDKCVVERHGLDGSGNNSI